MFINGLLKEVEQAGLGVELSDASTIGGMLFADDFVGVSSELRRLINVAHAYCCKWRLKANVSKSAVVVFARELVEGSLGRTSSPKLSKYTYLGVDFTSDGAWDEHESRVQGKCITIPTRITSFSKEKGAALGGTRTHHSAF